MPIAEVGVLASGSHVLRFDFFPMVLAIRPETVGAVGCVRPRAYRPYDYRLLPRDSPITKKDSSRFIRTPVRSFLGQLIRRRP